MMKTMMRCVAASLAVGSGLGLLGPETAASQERTRVRVSEVLACPEGMEEGSLGITGLDCVGECSLTIREGGAERSWFFSTEPKILGVERGGPADGIMEAGDFLVAIDGVLITSKEGGQRYAKLEPGERVTVRFRRDGRVREATIGVEARCRDMPQVPGVPSRVAPPPPDPDEPVTLGIAVSPRVRVAPNRRTVGVATGVTGVSTVAGRAPTGLLAGVSPTGRLGIGFSCNECGTQADEETGEEVWFFTGPLEVTAVTPGGPGDKAGIQRGDLIKAIDGQAINTDEGGLAFTRITAGERVNLTLVKRNGSEVDVGVIPEERSVVGVTGGVAVGRRATTVTPPPDPSRRATVVSRRPPAVPDPRAVPVPDVAVAAPEGMPLRYSGVFEGVEVEVRGEPVTVSETRGARTLYINADGLWIRITIPRRTILLDGGVVGLETLLPGGEGKGIGLGPLYRR